MRGLGAHAAVLAGLLVLPASAAAVDYPTPWSFVGIGPSQTTVKIVAQVGGCGQPLDAVAQETTTTVRIVARNTEPDGVHACPAIVGIGRRSVHLAAPLAGRRLLGATPQLAASFMPGRSTLPRVVGLAPGDAVTVLEAEGFHPRIVRGAREPGLRRVRAQHGVRLVVR